MNIHYLLLARCLYLTLYYKRTRSSLRQIGLQAFSWCYSNYNIIFYKILFSETLCHCAEGLF